MPRVLALLLAVTLAAAFPAAAQTPGAGSPCDAGAGLSMTDCCDGATPASDCPVADCAGAGSALLMELPVRAHASRVFDVVTVLVSLQIALPARAPDTAPPKPVV